MNPISSFINYFTKKQNSDAEVINQTLAIDDAKRSLQKKSVGEVFKKVKHKGIEYGGSISVRGIEFKPSEYDLNQVAAIIDIDSYLRRAIEKYVELILKNGFEFVGKSQSTTKYVRKRFEQIASVTNIPTLQLFEDICQQLVAYSNCFISKVRNEDASGGKKRTTFYGKELKPVAGYFVEDATSIFIAKDQNGKIIKYKQIIPGIEETPEWSPEDMIHIYYSRKRGLSFGTPLCYPVIDDIKALRKIEQNIEILSHQHTIPIIHYKVGNETKPGQPDEVSAIKSELESGAVYGCIVTTERHEIEGVDVKMDAEGVDKLAELFKMRVYAGLGVSPLVMGEGAGAGRQTAESLDRQMENTAEKFVKVIKTFVDEFMIREILAEGGYTYDAYNLRDKVELYFPPINMENKHKAEEHMINMYNNNLITESEARILTGRDPITESQRQDLNLQHSQIPLALIKSIDEQYTETTTKSPSGKSVKVKQGSSTPSLALAQPPANKKVANLAQPKNQHGKQLSRPKITKDNILKEKFNSHYQATIDDIIMSVEDYSYNTAGIAPIIKISKNLIKNNFKDYLMISYIDGYKSIKQTDLVNFENNIRDSIIQEELLIDKYFMIISDKVKKFVTEINDNNKIKNISYIQSIFDTYKDNFNTIIDEELIKSYNLGILQATKDNNINKLLIINDNCKSNHENRDLIIDSNTNINTLNMKCGCYFVNEGLIDG